MQSQNKLTRTKQTFSIATKLEVLDWMVQDVARTSYKASKHFNINSKTIRNWKDQETLLRKVTSPETIVRISRQKRQQQDLTVTPKHSLKSSEILANTQTSEITQEQFQYNDAINANELDMLLKALLRSPDAK